MNNNNQRKLLSTFTTFLRHNTMRNNGQLILEASTKVIYPIQAMIFTKTIKFIYGTIIHFIANNHTNMVI